MKAMAVALIVCFGLVSCKKARKPQATEKTPAPANKAKPALETPRPVAPASAPAVDKPPPWATPLKNQLSHEMVSVKFLGWTADGERFALETQHGRDMGQMAGQNLIRLRQVHDALTGKVVDAYRLRRVTDEKPSAPHNKAWAEAKPAKEWRAFKEATPLTGAVSRTRSPDKAWTLVGRLAGGAPGGTRVAVKPNSKLLRYVQTGFQYGRDDPKIKGPSFRIRLTGKKSFDLLTFQEPITYFYVSQNDWVDEKGPSVIGHVRCFWSPPGDRVVLVVSSDIHDGGHEEDPVDNAKYFIRTTGPQLQLVAPPAAEASARRLAKRLAKGGFPVTRLALTGKPRDKTVIYHRGGDGESLAKELAKLIPGSPDTAPLKKRGWLRLVVLLGGDA